VNPTFWARIPGSDVWKMMAIGLVLGIIIFFAISQTPTRVRKFVIGAFTFLAGSFYVLNFLWPTPVNRQPLDVPQGPVEQVSFLLADSIPVVKDFATILTAFLLGLGVFSLLRIHITRVVRQGKDWGFSVVLLVNMIVMCVFGYWKWLVELANDEGAKVDLSDPNNWGIAHKGFDFLFDGILQQMDAAMFSIIAFFILSAAYRAFRIRSVEATIMLATALILMLNLMGLMQVLSASAVGLLSQGDPQHWANNFKLEVIASWIKANLQVPSLRAMDFGIALGALAMGLRLWLNLEKSGVS
jgi:hypothetical protein